MKVWTLHTRQAKAPVLVREGFSWGALLFGPAWLLVRRAWIPAALAWCVWIGAALLPEPLGGLVLLALHWLLGLVGRDLLDGRWGCAASCWSTSSPRRMRTRPCVACWSSGAIWSRGMGA